MLAPATPPESLRSVTYTLGAAEAVACGKTMAKLRRPHDYAIAHYYVPAALGCLLIALCSAFGVADASGFLPLVVTGTIGYFAGILALHYDIMRYWRRQTLDLYGANPDYTEPWRIDLRADAIAVSTTRADATFRYGALLEAAIFDDLVVVWRNDRPEMLAPVSAFASRADAQAFVAAIRERITSAAARPT